MPNYLDKIYKGAIVLALLIFFALLLAQPISLVAADLGRHLVNGRLSLSHFSIPETNLYSYTYPDYPFVNHHWGTGVLFFLIQKWFGFAGLSIMLIVLSLATFWLFFHVAWKYSRFEIAALVSVVTIPLLVSRVEIRPELLSYLMAAIFFWVLWNIRSEKISNQWLWLLLPLQLLWVNIHIYFIFGILLTGAFFVESIILRKFLKKLLALLVFLTLISLINPLGLKGLLAPLQIFQNYGYRVLENQSVWFLAKIIPYPASLYFIIIFGLALLSLIYSATIGKKRGQDFEPVLLILFAAFSFLGWRMVRNFAFFGYFAIPITAISLKTFWPSLQASDARKKSQVLLLLFVLGAGMFFINPNFWQGRSVGLGTVKGMDGAGQFFVHNHIQGPIMNNYDIGGYLIYYLYPQQQVFVDNRPEAYPVSFFENIYVPMQEDETVWQKNLAQYNFNAIVFYRLDATPWAQQFLIARVKDPDWVPVFADDWAIIMLRNNATNQLLIKQYQIFSTRFTTN